MPKRKSAAENDRDADHDEDSDPELARLFAHDVGLASGPRAAGVGLAQEELPDVGILRVVAQVGGLSLGDRSSSSGRRA